ncbi:unnamed protein product [Absidia cylindrospora]
MKPLASRTEELVEILMHRIDHGESPQETLLAIKILGLAFINHNDETDQELLYQEASERLKDKLEKSRSKKIKAQCYETLALLTYIISSQIDAQMIRHEMYNRMVANADDDNDVDDDNDDDDDDDDENDDNDILMTSITRAYALMFVVSFCQGPVDIDIIQEEMDKVIGELELLMEFPGTLQTSAGQAVALMFESLRSVTDKSEDQHQNELNELVHTLRSLTMEQDEDEYMFQDILSTVEDGSQPYHEIEIDGKSFVLDRWSKIIPLNAFHRYLGNSGLDQHYKVRKKKVRG